MSTIILSKKKIFFVDDHSIVREGLNKIISLEKDMTVCGESDNINDAIIKIANAGPDLVIVDLSLGGETSGLDLLKAIRDRFPEIKTLVLSMYDETIYAERAMKAGASGYVMKSKASRDIVNAIRSVLDGNLFLSEEGSQKLLYKFLQRKNYSAESVIDTLTDRELEIYKFLGTGLNTGEIAAKLGLSINTIQTHKRNLMEKLSLKNTAELVKHAIQWDWSGAGEG